MPTSAPALCCARNCPTRIDHAFRSSLSLLRSTLPHLRELVLRVVYLAQPKGEYLFQRLLSGATGLTRLVLFGTPIPSEDLSCATALKALEWNGNFLPKRNNGDSEDERNERTYFVVYEHPPPPTLSNAFQLESLVLSGAYDSSYLIGVADVQPALLSLSLENHGLEDDGLKVVTRFTRLKSLMVGKRWNELESEKEFRNFGRRVAESMPALEYAVMEGTVVKSRHGSALDDAAVRRMELGNAARMSQPKVAAFQDLAELDERWRYDAHELLSWQGTTEGCDACGQLRSMLPAEILAPLPGTVGKRVKRR